MRVRLVNPLWALIARIDYRGGAQRGDFDDVFGDVKTKTVDGARVIERPEKQAIRVRCQLEDEQYQSLRMFDAGDSPEAKLGLVVERSWLRLADLLDEATGLPRLAINDRLIEVRDMRDQLVHQVADPPGLYCVEVRPVSYGGGRGQSLFLLRFNDRAQSVAT